MANIELIYPVYNMKFFIVIIIGFILFRFFDGIKPFYIDKVQEIKGGLGVMLDDVLAGIYSNIILIIIVNIYNTR